MRTETTGHKHRHPETWGTVQRHRDRDPGLRAKRSQDTIEGTETQDTRDRDPRIGVPEPQNMRTETARHRHRHPETQGTETPVQRHKDRDSRTQEQGQRFEDTGTETLGKVSDDRTLSCYSRRSYLHPKG